jgi:transposase-like protein
VDISIRHRDPWKHAIAHPLLDPDPEITLPVPASIRDPLILGQDPETGRPLSLLAWAEGHGGRNIYTIGKRDSGKTTLLSCIRERLTACGDVLVIDINLSKAQEDLNWAPACYLTAIGRGEQRKALLILRLVRAVIEERGTLPRDDKVFPPSRRAPAVALLIDEIDELAAIPGARKLLSEITSKGRSESVIVIGAGQRGTAEWMGGSDVRTQLDVICAGKVRRRSEIMHAAGELGMMIPDMATYGEGHAGVWAIVEDGGDYELGRSFDLSELTDIRQIAWDRRGSVPDLEPELKARLGDLLTSLREQQVAEYHGDDDAPPPDGAAGVPATPSSSPLRALGQLILSGEIGADDETVAQFAAAEEAEQRREAGWLSQVDAELEGTVTDEQRDQLRRIDERNAQTRQILNNTQMPDMTGVTPEQLAAFRQARWDQVAASTDIPPEARERLLGLLGGEGTTISRAAEALGVKQWTMRKWLERLRAEGLVHVEGEKRGRRWRLTSPGPASDGGDGK